MVQHSLLLLFSNISLRSSIFIKPPLVLMLSPNSISTAKSIKWYSSSSGESNKEWYSSRDDDDHEIGERGRSTAEEFRRVAQEMRASVPVTQKVEEDAFEGAQEEAVLDDPKKSNKYKESAEKRRFEKLRQEQD